MPAYSSAKIRYFAGYAATNIYEILSILLQEQVLKDKEEVKFMDIREHTERLAISLRYPAHPIDRNPEAMDER